MDLFEDQLKFVSDIRNEFKKNKRVVAQLPTGGGKGVVLSSIARDAIAKGKRPCISCHRIEIFQQLYKNLVAFGISPGLISAGQHPVPGSVCYLSMVETICRRMDKGLIDGLGIDFFILDEVHFGSYHKLVTQLDCYVLGFTATPKSTGKPELNEYFDSLVCGPSTRDLILSGRIVGTTTYSIDYDFSKVKMKGKEYDDRELYKEFKKPKLWDGAVNVFLEKAKGLQALCFCVNVEHSNATSSMFREHGIRSAHVDGATDKETRQRIFDMYRSGDLQIICNVGIATTGTDLPETKCVIQNFATTSLVKHIQTLGRGSRSSEGKKKFITIDMGRNYIRHGEFGEDISWERIFNNPSEVFQKKARKSKRECDNCGAVIRLHLNTCPYCNTKFSEKEIEEKFLRGATVSEVKAYRLKTMPPDLRKPIGSMNYPELVEYGKHMGYSPRWVHIVYAKRRK